MRCLWRRSIEMILLITMLFMGTFFAAFSSAAPRPLHTETNGLSLAVGVTNPPLRQIEAGVFQLGGVKLDKNKRTIHFPGLVNMNQGPIEYLLVNETGKVHESVFWTAVEPYHVHLAALLLRPKNKAALEKSDTNSIRELASHPVSISIRWQAGPSRMSLSGEKFVFNLQTKSAMTAGDWDYNGSRVIDGTFLGQRDGSIASVI